MRLRPVLAALAVLPLLAAACGEDAERAEEPEATATTPSPSPEPSPSPSPEDEDSAIGEWIRGENGRINVRAFELPAEPNREMTLSAGDGNALAAIQVAACPRDVPVEISETDLVLVDRDFTRYTFWNVQDHAKAPRIFDIGTIDTGDCGSGWITYIVPQAAQVREVLYLGADAFGPGIHDATLTWKVRR